MQDFFIIIQAFINKFYCFFKFLKMKKSYIIIFLALFFVNELFAQDWLSDYSNAKSLASEDHKNIIMVFAGSDWCAPCIKLEKYIWESKEFKAYAKENWILLKLDFPKRKANKLSEEQQNHNDALAEKYNKKGYFPLVVVLDANGKVLGETGYKSIAPQAYVDHLISFE